ncbi:FxSxx-COOH system tetratricopeptide repeat protein [Luedemannella helvata]|uniref:CobQ/CobB/MinD/ParA nucleotide binding domain-containing protein n=1 Tax=Luedemannella helvata TaxID=349315 RepID=A0ABN2JR20_9ACTN
MSENRNGQVVTFYSYKGGTGRTMALANIAWILAANGKRVLVVDWDLESPGLHRFLHPFIDPDALAGTGGVIDLIREFEWATTRDVQRDTRWYEQYARVHKFSFSLNWRHFPQGGTLDFLSAGQQDNDYATTLAGMNWDDFYERQGGGLFFDALRADMKRHYDYTLIDSRTGLSDVAEICTIHLPDTLVDCFTLSEQGIEGAAQVARRVQRHREPREIRILPVTMRVDPAEKGKVDVGRSVAKQRFLGLPADMTEPAREAYWARMQVPYQAYYAYEESLATFGDVPGIPGSLLSAYEMITKYLTNDEVGSLPPMDEPIRRRIIGRFARQPISVEDEVVLRYVPDDQIWAEWIEHILVAAGVRVQDPLVARPDAGEPVSMAAARQLTIVSPANAAVESALVHPEGGTFRPPLAVYIADTTPLQHLPIASSAFITGLTADEAAGRVLQLVGRSLDDIELASVPSRPRYPGDEPSVFNAPARNARFTGRENDLLRLRQELRHRGTAVVLPGAQPVALQGMGGIGKTQVALEYAYRFRAAYDVVWWINADPVTFIDSAIGDLGTQLGIPVQTGPDYTRAVLNALSRSEPSARWLLIFDNAEQPDRVGQFLPRGNGHILITSRNPQWGDQAETIQVDVFERRESIAHLVHRVPTMLASEADKVAEILGDLPIAIAAAGAWLAETGAPVDEYLTQIDRHGLSAVSVEESRDRSVEATWDLSLDRLRERSPAAFRLLQLCSVLAPEISLDLIYSDEMANALMPFDPAVSERLVRGSLVQQINRLALLRVDQRGERGQSGQGSHGGQVLIHRVLQHVVRSRMTDVELRAAEHEVHLVLAAARPNDGEVDDPDTWPRFRMLWPHLEASDAVNCYDEVVRRLLIDRIRYMWIHAELDEGRRRAEQIVTNWAALMNELPDDRDRPALVRQLLHLRFNYANILRNLGLFTESFSINSTVLEDQKNQLGEQHPHTLMTAAGLAGDLRGLGRYPEALELDLASYASWLEVFGEDHPRTLSALHNVAASYRLMGNFRAARDHDEQAYRRKRVVLSENHPSTLGTAGNLGRDLRDAGEYERSSALLTTVADTFAQVWGATSRWALTAQTNLAVSMGAAGRAEEARRLLDTAYAELNDSYGPTNPDTLECRLSRSLNMLAVDDFDRAHRELTEVHGAYLEQLGKLHPHTIVCENNLAMVARALGDRGRAMTFVRKAAENLRAGLGPDHPYSLAGQVNLAIILAESDRLEDALALVQEAASGSVRTLGQEHPDTLRCMGNLALILRRLGRPEPELGAVRLADRLAQRIGAENPAVISLRHGQFLNRIIDPHPF